jgi:hypothetical protein
MSVLAKTKAWVGGLTIRWPVLRAVICDAWPVGLFILGLAFAGLVGWSIGKCASPAVRYAGASLEIFGVLTIAHGLRRLRKQFGPASSNENWFIRLGRAFRRAEPKTLQASAGSIAIVGGNVSMRRSAGTGASLDVRLEVLEANFKQFEQETSRQIQANIEKVSHLKAELDQERDARSEADRATSKQIKDMAIGGLDIEFIGLIWVVLGIIGASIPGECR